MTEAEARALLWRAGYDGLNPWIAAQSWQDMSGGWQVVPALQGWHFRVEVAGAGQLRVTASAPGGDPTVWTVPHWR